MHIGIIGAGFIGRALAKHAVDAGHEVMISNSRGPRTLGSTCAAIGCRAGTVEEAAQFGELVVIAIPLASYTSVPASPLAGKIVVDANNYYPERDGRIAELDTHQTTTSEMLARHLPQSRVVKAFNAIMAPDIDQDSKRPGTPGRRALPIAGDDAQARAVVARFVDDVGFDVVDCGALKEGWRFERARPAYCVPFGKEELAGVIAATTPDSFVAEYSWRRNEKARAAGG